MSIPPSMEGFLYNSHPLGISVPEGSLVPPPLGISKFLKGCSCSPTPCFIRKGFSLKHRCKCQVKPTTYLTSIESHFIVYFIIAKNKKKYSKMIGCPHKKKRSEHVAMSNSDGCLSYTKKKKKLIKDIIFPECI